MTTAAAIDVTVPWYDPRDGSWHTHLEWAARLARRVRRKFRFRPRSEEESDLEQTARTMALQKAKEFDFGMVPSGGDPDGQFRGWLYRHVIGACRREAYRLRNGGTFDTTRNPEAVRMPEQGLPINAPLARETSRRSVSDAAEPSAPLALCDSADVSFRLTANSLTVEGECDVNEWTQAFERLRDRSESFRWAVGDLAVYGIDLFGEAARRVVAAAGYSDKAVVQAVWVCRAFPPDTRVSNVSFTHHRAVAALPFATARELLKKSAANGTSTRDLEDKVRLLREGVKVPDPALQLTRPAGRIEKALADLAPADWEPIVASCRARAAADRPDPEDWRETVRIVVAALLDQKRAG